MIAKYQVKIKDLFEFFEPQLKIIDFKMFRFHLYSIGKLGSILQYKIKKNSVLELIYIGLLSTYKKKNFGCIFIAQFIFIKLYQIHIFVNKSKNQATQNKKKRFVQSIFFNSVCLFAPIQQTGEKQTSK